MRNNQELSENITNYDITQHKMEQEFLKYDQKVMVEKFHLKADETYLYIEFIGSKYRIHRFTGVVEVSQDEFENVRAAGYNEAMTLYDVLCYSKEDCRLAGEYCSVNSLPKVAYCAAPGEGLFAREAERFDRKSELLAAACEKLGGIKKGKGDVSYCVPVFDFFPVMIQFWESDEEFPASIQFFWDKNTLDYMHYETTYYAVQEILRRLAEVMEEISQARPQSACRPSWNTDDAK